MNSRRNFLRSAGGAVAVTGLAGCLGDDDDDGTITIGLYGPLTGPAADIGEAMELGAELAAENINDDGGILDREIELAWADSESNPAEGRSAVDRLIDRDGIDILAGGFHSDVTLSVIEVTHANDVPQMISNSVAGAINEKILSEEMWNVFKMSPPNLAYGEAYGEWFDDLQEEGIGYFPYEDQTVAMIGEDTSYGIDVMASTEEHLAERGWDIISTDEVEVDEADFASLLARIEDNEPDIVWAVQTAPSAAASLIQDFRDTGFENTHFIHTFVPSNPETIELAGDAANGLLWAANVDIVPEYAEEVGIYDAWEDMYGTDVPGSSGSLPYDNMYLIREALESGLDDLDELTVDTWRDAVIDMEPTMGASGIFDFTDEQQAQWGVDYVPPIGFQIRDNRNHSVWPFGLAADEIDESLY